MNGNPCHYSFSFWFNKRLKKGTCMFNKRHSVIKLPTLKLYYVWWYHPCNEPGVRKMSSQLFHIRTTSRFLCGDRKMRKLILRTEADVNAVISAPCQRAAATSLSISLSRVLTPQGSWCCHRRCLSHSQDAGPKRVWWCHLLVKMADA